MDVVVSVRELCVAHVCTQIGQHGVQVFALTHPAIQPVGSESMTKIIKTRGTAASSCNGESASDGGDSHMPHPHESPLAMTLPLMLLAVVTIIAGFIPFGHFISSNGEAYNIHLDWSVAGTSIAVAVVSIAIATYIYAGSRQPVADTLAHRFKGLWFSFLFLADKRKQGVVS